MGMFAKSVDAISESRLLSVFALPLSAIGYSDSWALSLVERLFPLVPTLGPEDVNNWKSPEVYYFLDDLSPRVGARLWAVVTLNRRQVSFWRKRQQLLKL